MYCSETSTRFVTKIMYETIFSLKTQSNVTEGDRTTLLSFISKAGKTSRPAANWMIYIQIVQLLKNKKQVHAAN